MCTYVAMQLIVMLNVVYGLHNIVEMISIHMHIATYSPKISNIMKIH